MNHFCRLTTRQQLAMLLLYAFSATSLHAADFYISSQRDFNAFYNATFSPGDNIYFEKGKVFTGMFAPTVVGTESNPINISTFGSGNKPIINNQGVLHSHPTRPSETISAGVFLFNPEYARVSGLEITNNNGGDQDGDNLFGIYVLSEDTGKYHNSIHIEDNYVHRVNGAVAGKGRGGIHVHGFSPQTSNASTYHDLRIVNNVVAQVGGVGIATNVSDVPTAVTYNGTSRPNAITDLYIGHNWIGNTGRNTVIARASDDGLVEYNTSANSSLYDKGHSFFNFNTIGLVFQHNEAYGNIGPENQSDRGGFDADWNSKDTTIQYNYSHSNNYFAGVMKKPNDEVTIRYNLSVNEERGAYFYGFENDTDLTDVKIYNNTHFFDGSIEEPELIVRQRTPHETVFNNNIFYALDSGTPGPNADEGVNVTFDTNVYYEFTAPTTEINPLYADPLFVSPGAEPYNVDMLNGRDVLNGYRLSVDSPYLSNGVLIADNGGRDFWGNALVAGTPSIGASQINPIVGLMGDFNNDGTVDAADYSVWRDNFGASDLALNGNGYSDGSVDSLDYDIWAANYGITLSSLAKPLALAVESTSVPEPTGLLLGLISFLMPQHRKNIR